MVYANLSYPIDHSPLLQTVLYTCGSDAHSAFGVLQTPNGNPGADIEISPTSHEIMEVGRCRLRERRRVRLCVRDAAEHGWSVLQPGDQPQPLLDSDGVQQQRLLQDRPRVPAERIAPAGAGMRALLIASPASGVRLRSPARSD